MADHNILLLLFLISMTWFVENTSSLNTEGVLHGQLGSRRDFAYTTAILERKNKDANLKLAGNGVLVSANWILSVAQIFMKSSMVIRNVEFIAVLGYATLNFRTASSEQPIIEIHTFGYVSQTSENDIAMAKLPVSIDDIEPFPGAWPLKLASPAYSNLKIFGRVGGFGNQGTKKGPIELHYIHVQAKATSNCAKDYSRTLVNELNHFCGVSMDQTKKNGVCSKDVGSPLVVNNDYVVGLVTKTHSNCDDTARGALYVNASAYYDFINNTVEKVKMEGVSVFGTLQFPMD